MTKFHRVQEERLVFLENVVQRQNKKAGRYLVSCFCISHAIGSILPSKKVAIGQASCRQLASRAVTHNQCLHGTCGHMLSAERGCQTGDTLYSGRRCRHKQGPENLMGKDR